VSTRLGPESAEVQRRSHYELLRSAIGAWGAVRSRGWGQILATEMVRAMAGGRGAVAASLGSQPAAQLLYDRLLPWQEHVVFLGTGGGRVSHYLGLLTTTLGHHDEAEHHFAEEGLQRAKKHGFRPRTPLRGAP